MKKNSNTLRNTLLWLENLSVKEKEFIFERLEFILDIFNAQSNLPTFILTMSIKNRKPKYWEIRFSYNDLSKYEILKKYTGEYGFVVPTMWSKTKKILRGEKRLKYPI